MERPSLRAILITYNEEERLARALEATIATYSPEVRERAVRLPRGRRLRGAFITR